MFPATFAQQRLWFLEQLQPGGTSYLIPWSLRISGNLNVEALGQALNEIVRRHEVLRTTFSFKDGAPVQVVAGELCVPIPVVDLSSRATREEDAKRLALEEANKPLDLERGPLVRAQLLRLGTEEHVLLLTMHHIIFDGWSRRIFIRELAELYEAFGAGRTSALAEPKLQYADYAVWQRKQFHGANLEKQLSYWRQQLAGAPASLDLPTDRPRPALQTFNGAKQPLSFSQELTQRLQAFSRERGVTVFMTLLAGFQILLSRYSNQDDVVVGTPIANRNRAEIEEMIGYFANTLVLRSKLSREAKFTEFLAQVKETALGAYANQDVPFEKLVEELRPDRNLSQNPLFQVLFSLQNAPRQAFELPGLKLSSMDSGEGTAKFDISVFLSETPDGVRGRFEYNTDIFDAETIQRMIGHYQVLLEAAITSPEREVSLLPLLTESEETKILVDWNATAAEYPRTLCLHQLIAQQAARTPDAIACLMAGDSPAEDQRLSYGEFDARANQLAHALRRRGIAPGQRVGIFVERSLEMMVGLVGIQKAGAAYVPLDPGYPAERVRLTLEDARVPVLLTQRSLVDSLPESGAQVICLDSDWAEIAKESSAPLNVAMTPEDLAYVIFTSGSTGRPKGVQVRHKGVVNLLTAMAKELRMGPGDVVPALASFAFDMCIPELYLALISGGQVVIGKRHLAGNGEELAGLLRRTGATVIHATPTTWSLLLEAGFTGKGLKRVIGAEPLPRDLCRRLLEADDSLYNFYGPTETTVWSAFHHFRSPEEPVVVGRPLANQQIYILDADLHPVPVGVAGEIHIGGDGVAAGYLAQPELTAAKFIPDPFSTTPGATIYKTGDMGRFLADGRIQFQGRADHQVKIRGYRIELGEIEAALGKHPAVQECVVVAREDVPSDKRLVGYVIGAVGHSVNASELRAWVKERLPEYMVPVAMVEMQRFPLSPNGKVDRSKLPAPEYTRPELESEYQRARTPAEEVISAIWAEVLKLDQVGVHDNFFELGGHSLLATQVVSRIRQVFQIDLPLRALFEAPTVAGLAEKALALQGTAHEIQAPPLKAVSRDQALPLSFAQQRLWFLNKLEPNNPLYNVPHVVRLKGTLNVAAMEAALNQIIARHESLRTTFRMVNGSSAQVIAPSLTVRISTTALPSLPGGTVEDEARKVALAEIARPFDLQAGPLIRALLLKLADRDHVLILNTHHIISDRWSLGVLAKELAALYEQAVTGKAAELPSLPLQYADYSAWQRQMLSGATLEKQLGYWKQNLAGAAASLDLPTDRPRPPQQSFRGAKHTVVLPKALSDQITALGRKEGATLFMTLLAAFNILLSRYSGQEDIVIGSPIAGRTRADLEGLIGFFVNTLVLRADVSENPTFRDLLAQVRETAMGAYAHQDVPFERLVEELRPERDLSRNPLFQVMFVLQNVPAVRQTMGQVEVAPFLLPGESSKFDLTLFVSESADGLRAAIEYNTDLFEPSTIERMLGHFQVLLESAVAQPDLRIGQLPMLREAERRKVLVEFNATEREFPSGLGLHHLLEQAAQRSPGATAVVCGTKRTTYRELNSRANQIAHYLIQRGAGPGELVGVFLERNWDLLPAILGVLKSGAAYVPLDPSYPRERLAAILEDAKAPIVLTQQSLATEVGGGVSKAICVDSDWDKIARESDADPAVEFKPEDLAYVLFTSGSTGRPKGVALEHRSAAMFVQWAQTVFSPEELAGVLLSTSVCFDLSIFEIFVPLSAGGKVIVVQNALFLPSAEAKDEVTLINTVPSAMAELVRMKQVPGSVRTINLAGEALAETLVNQIYSSTSAKKVYNLYGPTEDTTYSTYTLTQPNQPVTIGRPLPNTQAYIVDRYGNPQPIGIPGELYLAGAGLARGYYGRPDLTAERFVANPFNVKSPRMYRTGDLCRWRATGDLEYLGRLDHQIKLRGYRIELGEIEAALAKHGSIRQCLVMAREDEPGVKRLVAYVVAAAGETPETEELREHLKRGLPEFMVPAAFVALDAFPLTPNGKVDRRALPRPEFQASAGAVPPRDELEEKLQQIWQEILQTGAMGVTDNFFELGGHSLLAVRMVNEIKQLTGVDIPLTELFQGATIEHLADVVRGTKTVRQTVVQQIQAGGDRPPFFAIVTPGVNALGYVALGRHLGEDQPLYRIQKLGPRVQGRPYSTQEYDELASCYVDALKTAQPEGPYLLGGMCEGARIAFDMARKLESSGDQVSLLAIFDTWVVENTQNRLLWYLFYYGQRIKTQRSLAARERWAEMRKAVRNLQLRFLGRRSVVESQWRGAYWPGRDFVPPKFGGTITVFKLRKQPFYYVRDPLMGWGSRTRAGVETHVVSGEHNLILREPNVQSLAKELGAVIDRLTAKETPKAMEPSVHGGELVDAPPQWASSELTANTAEASRERESVQWDLTEALERRPAGPEAPGSACPLSAQQRRLWVLSKLENSGSAHNVPILLHLHGELDQGALQESLDALLARNRILRSRFIMDRETPSRFVFNDRPIVLHTVNLSQLGAQQRGESVLELATEALEIAFDLELDLLLRACLFQLGPREHLLSLVTHQAVCDSASASILARELMLFYTGFVEDRDPGLSNAAYYSDYAVWQDEYRQSNQGAEDLAYWKNQLAGCNGGVELPADFPRPAVQSFAGGQHLLVLEDGLLSRVKKLSRREGVSVFEFLLAAFFALLSRYSALDDVVLGSEVSGLNHPVAQDTIGCFANQLVLRADLSGDPTFREVLTRIKGVWAGAMAHQDAPFADVIRQFDLDRDLSKNPLFQVMFSHERGLTELPRAQNFRAELVPPPRVAETLDLSVRVTEREDKVELRFSYSTDLFAASTIARMASHYRILLGAGSENPELRLSNLPLLTAAERQQLVVDWNQTTANHPARCIQQFFQEQVGRTPNAAALIFDEQRMSYAELDSRSNRLARYLQKHGVAPDVLVGICCERTPDLLVGMLAILKAGGAYVPLDPNYPKDRLQAILEDAKAPLLLTQAELVELLPKSSARVICLDRDWNAIAAESAANVESEVGPDDLAYVLFTSGSTGRPKGVAIQHSSASAFIQWAKSVFSPDDLAGVLFSTSVCFDLSIFELFVTLSAGGKVVITQDVLHLPGLPAAEQVTLINTVPSAMTELLRMGGVPGAVRVVNLAGEPLTRALADQIYALGTVKRVYNLYGPTEDTTYSTFTLVSDDQTPITIGKPITNSQAYILDSHLEPVPVGVPGELYLGGQGLARGYYGRPDLTAERFIRDPFNPAPGARLYRTGDLARFLPDGDIEYLGRIDHQVKLRGFRIEMGEIESVLTRHPSVRQSVVTLREDIPGDKRLVAYVTPAGAQAIDTDELRLWLKEKLPEFMVPSHLVALESLPLTANGKLDRRALPSPQQEARDQSRIVAPRNEMEALLVSIFQSILGVESLGISDDFFDLGGHSLMAARLVSEVQSITGKRLSLSALFHGATPEFLAHMLESGLELDSDPIAMAIQPGNGAPAFFCVVPPGENAVGYVKLARYTGVSYPFYKLQGSGPGIGDRPYSAPEMQALAERYVQAMRAVQPSGPYYFGGMCDGAHIACRMARTLDQQGEQVGMLAVFDTWVLENTQKPVLSYAHYYSQRLHAFLRLSNRQRMQVAFRAFRSAVSRARGGQRSTWSQAYWPGDGFVPPTFSGKVALFKRPKQPFYYVDDPEMGWGSRSRSAVDVQVLPIDHEEMLHEPYVRILARRLAECLQNYYEAARGGQPERDREAYATAGSATHHEVS